MIIDIPLSSDQVDDLNGPWVLTYRDDGPLQPSGGGGFPTRVALIFENYDALQKYWQSASSRRGRNCKVDSFPLRMPQ